MAVIRNRVKTSSVQSNIEVVDWVTFKQRYHKELEHVVGFEEKFVDLVLSQIDEIQPTDVIPQYHIKDIVGNRYIDFVIINKDKGWKIAIELDGLGKMFDDNYVTDREDRYRRFDDMLNRQNTIVIEGFLVLRFTNKTMLNNAGYIVKTIKELLINQNYLYEADKSIYDEIMRDRDEYFQLWQETLKDVMDTAIRNEQLTKDVIRFKSMHNEAIAGKEVLLNELNEYDKKIINLQKKLKYQLDKSERNISSMRDKNLSLNTDIKRLALEIIRLRNEAKQNSLNVWGISIVINLILLACLITYYITKNYLS